jgi:hypothetical protein
MRCYWLSVEQFSLTVDSAKTKTTSVYTKRYIELFQAEYATVLSEMAIYEYKTYNGWNVPGQVSVSGVRREDQK